MRRLGMSPNKNLLRSLNMDLSLHRLRLQHQLPRPLLSSQLLPRCHSALSPPKQRKRRQLNRVLPRQPRARRPRSLVSFTSSMAPSPLTVPPGQFPRLRSQPSQPSQPANRRMTARTTTRDLRLPCLGDPRRSTSPLQDANPPLRNRLLPLVLNLLR